MGWNGIYRHSVVSQNHNEPSFKIVWISQSLSYIDIFLNCLPLKCLIIFILPSTYRAMKEAVISLFTLEDVLRYFGLWLLLSICSGWNRGGFIVSPPLINSQIHSPISLLNSCLNATSNAITRERRFNNTNPPPYVDRFWEIHQMVKAWNDHMTFIFLDSRSI